MRARIGPWESTRTAVGWACWRWHNEKGGQGTGTEENVCASTSKGPAPRAGPLKGLRQAARSPTWGSFGILDGGGRPRLGVGRNALLPARSGEAADFQGSRHGLAKLGETGPRPLKSETFAKQGAWRHRPWSKLATTPNDTRSLCFLALAPDRPPTQRRRWILDALSARSEKAPRETPSQGPSASQCEHCVGACLLAAPQERKGGAKDRAPSDRTEIHADRRRIKTPLAPPPSRRTLGRPSAIAPSGTPKAQRVRGRRWANARSRATKRLEAVLYQAARQRHPTRAAPRSTSC